MSEAELHIIKARMLEGKRAKARRGELGMRLPMGYVRRPSGEVALDPDEQAQSTIRLVFDLFERFRTVGKVMVYLVEHDIRMPVRNGSGPNKGELTWHRANRVSLHNLFSNPTYAGAYVYGKRTTDPRRRKPVDPAPGVGQAALRMRRCFCPIVCLATSVGSSISATKRSCDRTERLSRDHHALARLCCPACWSVAGADYG
jgi:hypothetical protein